MLPRVVLVAAATAARVVLVAAATAAADVEFGGYFANWARWRPAPYTFEAKDVAGAAGLTDTIMYGFAYFCPPAGDTAAYWVADDCKSWIAGPRS